MVRFSGLQIDGSGGQDGYHFHDLVRPDRVAVPTDNMAPFEYEALMTESAAAPLIMLNFGSGSAAEAGRYVRHLDGQDPVDPDVAARAHWGHPAP